MGPSRDDVRAGKVVVVDAPRSRKVGAWIDAEDDLHDVPPIGTLGLSIEQTEVEARMLPVVVGSVVTAKRFVNEGEFRHAGLGYVMIRVCANKGKRGRC